MINFDEYQLVAYGSLIIGSIIGMHSLFLLSRSRTTYVVKIIYPVVFTLCVLFGAQTYIDLQGYAVKAMPAPDSEYVHHEQVSDGIAAWFKLKDGRARLHIIENSEKNRETMEEAKEAKKKGKIVKTKRTGTNKFNREEQTIVVEVLDPKDVYQKEQ